LLINEKCIKVIYFSENFPEFSFCKHFIVINYSLKPNGAIIFNICITFRSFTNSNVKRLQNFKNSLLPLKSRRFINVNLFAKLGQIMQNSLAKQTHWKLK